MNTAQKIKFSIKDFFSKCNQNRRKLRIWSHLLKKSLMENFFFVRWNLHNKNEVVSERYKVVCEEIETRI